MHYLFPLLFSAIIFISTAARTVKKKQAKYSPDVDEFIEKLLSSDKFEKFADRIAEKAADKIIAIQGGSKHDTHVNTADGKSAEDNRVLNRANENSSESSEASKNETDNKQINGEIKEKKKINTLAVIEKFNEHDAKDISLKFKHFLTAKGVSGDTKAKLRSDNNIGTKLKEASTESEEENNIVDHSKLRILIKNDEQLTEKPKIIQIAGDNTSEDESSASVSYSSEFVGEERNKTAKKVSNTNGNIGRQGKQVSRESDSSKADSDYVELTTVGILDRKSQTEDNSGQYSQEESNENVLVASGRIDNQAASETKHFRQYSSEGNVQNNLRKEAAEQPVIKETESPIDKMDLKHKVREQNGKLYAFAQHPDYEEYHQEVKNILKRVQENGTDFRRDDVNLDLLDLVE